MDEDEVSLLFGAIDLNDDRKFSMEEWVASVDKYRKAAHGSSNNRFLGSIKHPPCGD